MTCSVKKIAISRVFCNIIFSCLSVCLCQEMAKIIKRIAADDQLQLWILWAIPSRQTAPWLFTFRILFFRKYLKDCLILYYFIFHVHAHISIAHARDAIWWNQMLIAQILAWRSCKMQQKLVAYINCSIH